MATKSKAFDYDFDEEVKDTKIFLECQKDILDLDEKQIKKILKKYDISETFAVNVIRSSIIKNLIKIVNENRLNIDDENFDAQIEEIVEDIKKSDNLSSDYEFIKTILTLDSVYYNHVMTGLVKALIEKIVSIINKNSLEEYEQEIETTEIDFAKDFKQLTSKDRIIESIHKTIRNAQLSLPFMQLRQTISKLEAVLRENILLNDCESEDNIKYIIDIIFKNLNKKFDTLPDNLKDFNSLMSDIEEQVDNIGNTLDLLNNRKTDENPKYDGDNLNNLQKSDKAKRIAAIILAAAITGTGISYLVSQKSKTNKTTETSSQEETVTPNNVTKKETNKEDKKILTETTAEVSDENKEITYTSTTTEKEPEKENIIKKEIINTEEPERTKEVVKTEEQVKEVETVIQTTNIESQIKNNANVVYNNWSCYTSEYSLSNIEELIKLLNGEPSSIDYQTADMMITNIINIATTTAFNNALVKNKANTTDINVSSLLIKNQAGLEAVKALENYLNGAMRNTSDDKSFTNFLDSALIDETHIISGETFKGMNVSANSNTSKECKILWSRLAIGINTLMGILGEEHIYQNNGIIYLANDVLDYRIYESIVDASINQYKIN